MIYAYVLKFGDDFEVLPNHFKFIYVLSKAFLKETKVKIYVRGYGKEVLVGEVDDETNINNLPTRIHRDRALEQLTT